MANTTPVKYNQSSRSWSSPKSPSSFISKFAIGISQISKSKRNSYFQVVIKIGDAKFQQVSIMEAASSSTVRGDLEKFRDQVVKLNVSQSVDGKMFFHESRGGQIQAIKYPLTFGSVIEERSKPGDVSWENLSDFFKPKTSSQSESTSTVCCPDIISVKIYHHLLCPLCKAPRAEGKLVLCTNCDHESVEKHALRLLEGEINVKKDDVMLTLVFDEAFVEKNYAHYKIEGNKDYNVGDIEDDILLLEEVDFIYNNVKMSIVEIKCHDRIEGIDKEKENEENESEGMLTEGNVGKRSYICSDDEVNVKKMDRKGKKSKTYDAT